MLLTLCLAMALALSTTLSAQADDKQKDLESQKNELQSQLDALNQQISAVQGDKADAEAAKQQYQNQKTLITQQIALINGQIETLEQQIADKEVEINDKQAEVEAKQAEYDARWAGFKERMNSMQKLNDGGSIALLSSATNLYELLTFAHTLEEISSKDQEICADLENQRIALDDEKVALENAKAELEANEASLSDQQNQLSSKEDELVANIQATDSTISEADAREQALEETKTDTQAEFDRVADELDAYLASLIKQTQAAYTDAPISCSLNFICPLASYKYISCQYGNGGHKGVDFAAPGGTPIKAIASGVVTVATYHYSYGNYVMVYHGVDDSGNTYATLYAHMVSSPSVSAGESVSQGQVLGYVGSTGNSTGNHLHLELRVNGARTNPLNYVPH